MQILFALVAAFFLLGISALFSSAVKPEKVLLKDVTTLVLDDAKKTTGRRHSSVPQLRCVGGPCELAPHRVMCEQKGWDGRDATWECKANMPGARFGKLDVTCEGFDSKKDPFVLAGSCGLEYTLIPTGTGTAHRDPRVTRSYHTTNTDYISNTFKSNYSDWSWSWLLATSLLAMCAYAMYKCAKFALVGGARGVNSIGSGAWGLGGLGNLGGLGGLGGLGSGVRDVPPSYNSALGTKARSAQSAQSSSGPGFWSGMMGGMGLSYLMGRTRNRDHLGRGVRTEAPVYVVHSPARSPVATTESGYATTKRR